LTGPTSKWYMHLEQSHIKCFKNLGDAFLRQFKYNNHVAPDRMQSQNMTKKNEETFKEYAQRWRELAVQVEPLFLEK